MSAAVDPADEPRLAELSRSPRITGVRWGELRVEGLAQPLKDAKLYPGGARSWDWRETGTAHRPGIQLSAVEELLERGAHSVVLSRGMLGRLGVMPAVLAELARRGIPVHRLRTPAAIRRYNELAAVGPVGALIHSTC